MGPSFWQILIVAVVIILLFGAGKIPRLMGDLAKGINSFKKGINENDTDSTESKTIDHEPAETVSPSKAEEKTKAS